MFTQGNKHKPSSLVSIIFIFITTMSFVQYDLVITGGRVMDPESGFDKPDHNVGVIGGTIAIITSKPISGKESIDAKGMVICPGFIEGHVHSTDQFSLKACLRDGLTTAMDCEAGIRDTAKWYASHEGKVQLNYGHVANAGLARMAVLDGMDVVSDEYDMAGMLKSINKAGAKAKEEGRPMGWNAALPDKRQMTQIMELLDEELREGALGIGVPVGYMTHGVTSYEFYKYQELASKYGRLTNSHTRFAGIQPPNSGALGIQELMANAMVLDSCCMISHLNSVMDWEFTINYVNMARRRGFKIFGEVYPYHAGSTIGSTDILSPEGMESMGISYEDVFYVSPHQRWNKEIYDKRFDEPGKVCVIENNKKENIKIWMADPDTVICSDAMPCLGPKGEDLPWDTPFEGWTVHPRGSGTRGCFLRLVREEMPQVSLMTAISRMTYLPAKYFAELAGIPHFSKKGRLQEGCDADIVVFDPDTVTDNSSYEIGAGMLPTTGIPYVIVNGTVVVKDSVVLPVFPGKPIRFPVQPKGRVDQLKVDPPFRPGMGENKKYIEHLSFNLCC